MAVAADLHRDFLTPAFAYSASGFGSDPDGLRYSFVGLRFFSATRV